MQDTIRAIVREMEELEANDYASKDTRRCVANWRRRLQAMFPPKKHGCTRDTNGGGNCDVHSDCASETLRRGESREEFERDRHGQTGDDASAVRCRRCESRQVKRIPELLGAGWRWYCETCGELWPETPAVYYSNSDAVE